MPRKYIQWLVNHNMKVVVYFIWLIALPLYWFTYLGRAMQDALWELDSIKRIEKEKYEL